MGAHDAQIEATLLGAASADRRISTSNDGGDIPRLCYAGGLLNHRFPS
jgi:hypothetical protein